MGFFDSPDGQQYIQDGTHEAELLRIRKFKNPKTSIDTYAFDFLVDGVERSGSVDFRFDENKVWVKIKNLVAGALSARDGKEVLPTDLRGEYKDEATEILGLEKGQEHTHTFKKPIPVSFTGAQAPKSDFVKLVKIGPV